MNLHERLNIVDLDLHGNSIDGYVMCVLTREREVERGPAIEKVDDAKKDVVVEIEKMHRVASRQSRRGYELRIGRFCGLIHGAL